MCTLRMDACGAHLPALSLPVGALRAPQHAMQEEKDFLEKAAVAHANGTLEGQKESLRVGLEPTVSHHCDQLVDDVIRHFVESSGFTNPEFMFKAGINWPQVEDLLGFASNHVLTTSGMFVDATVQYTFYFGKVGIPDESGKDSHFQVGMRVVVMRGNQTYSYPKDPKKEQAEMMWCKKSKGGFDYVWVHLLPVMTSNLGIFGPGKGQTNILTLQETYGMSVVQSQEIKQERDAVFRDHSRERVFLFDDFLRKATVGHLLQNLVAIRRKNVSRTFGFTPGESQLKPGEVNLGTIDGLLIRNKFSRPEKYETRHAVTDREPFDLTFQYPTESVRRYTRYYLLRNVTNYLADCILKSTEAQPQEEGQPSLKRMGGFRR